MKPFRVFLDGAEHGLIYGWNIINALGRAKLLYKDCEVMVVETEDE